MAPINDAFLWGRKAAREGVASTSNPYRGSAARSECHEVMRRNAITNGGCVCRGGPGRTDGLLVRADERLRLTVFLWRWIEDRDDAFLM
ncbi:MAG: hypothetical protein IE913_05595 [Halothiobacillus sp.]|nr:hypothetical protein [Halothiobacillus sp.]